MLILRNHGLLVACPGIPEAFTTYWTLQRACEIQAATDAMAGDNLPITQKCWTRRRRGPRRSAGRVPAAWLRRPARARRDLV